MRKCLCKQEHRFHIYVINIHNFNHKLVHDLQTHTSLPSIIPYEYLQNSCSSLVSSIKIMGFIGPAGDIVLKINIEYR
jgi:hypothetical protein